MEKKIKIIMWTLCILDWVCAITNVIIRPYSIITWWILFSIQIMCLLGLFIILIISVIQFKRTEKRLNAEYEKLWKEFFMKMEEAVITDDDVKPSETIKPADEFDGGLENKE